MPWIRIDDHFDEHPKFAMAGPLGIALWLAGLAYCNRNLTDGRIPWATARSLLTWSYLDPKESEAGRVIWTISVTSGHRGEDVTCERVIDLLVQTGLWEERDGGYYVHDYPSYQPLKEQVLAERESARARMKAIRSGDVRANFGRSSPSPVPVPVPVPVTKEKKDTVPAARSLFVKPTLQEVQAYCQERRNSVDPQAWMDHYESNGWKVGRNPMKDWKAAVRTWEKHAFGNGKAPDPSPAAPRRDYGTLTGRHPDDPLEKAARWRKEQEQEESGK